MRAAATAGTATPSTPVEASYPATVASASPLAAVSVLSVLVPAVMLAPSFSVTLMA